jgi:hypothetical protein
MHHRLGGATANEQRPGVENHDHFFHLKKAPNPQAGALWDAHTPVATVLPIFTRVCCSHKPVHFIDVVYKAIDLILNVTSTRAHRGACP